MMKKMHLSSSSSLYLAIVIATYLMVTLCFAPITSTLGQTPAPWNDGLRRANTRLLSLFKCRHGISSAQTNGKWYKYDACLDGFAQDWANTMSSTNTFSHSPNPYGNTYAQCTVRSGENVGWGYTSSIAFHADLYNEIIDWDFTTSTSTGGVTGHFTALVWAPVDRWGLGVKQATVPYSGSFYPNFWSENMGSSTNAGGNAPNTSGYYNRHVYPIDTTKNWTQCETEVWNYYQEDSTRYFTTGNTGVDGYLAIRNIVLSGAGYNAATKTLTRGASVTLTWANAGTATTPYTIRFCNVGTESLPTAITSIPQPISSCTDVATAIVAGTTTRTITVPTTANIYTHYASLCIINGDEKSCVTGLKVN